MIKNWLFLFFLACLFLSCQKKNVEVKPTVFDVEKMFKPYFQSFLKEAAARNVKIDTTNLIIKINNSLNIKKCGTCTQSLKNPNLQKTIEIYTQNPLCWATATANGKEALIFHELGHCLLGRIDHKNDTFSDGSPKSIMVAENTDLYTPCVYVLDELPENCNKTNRRKYYIDELFDPSTPKPNWAP